MRIQTLRPRVAFFALVAANTVSLLGNVVAAVALPWFVLETTGSAARAGAVAFFTTLPLALGALFGGTVADRFGHRTTSVVGDLASCAAIGAIPALHAADSLSFRTLLVLAFLGAVFDGPGQAAREARLPESAANAGMSLERATGIWTTTEHVGYIVGAPLAGVLIASVGAPGALVADAASFAASALVVATLVPFAPTLARRAPYISDMIEGLRFVWREHLVRSFLLLAMAGNFLIAPLAPVLLPVYAREELGGAGDLGLLLGLYGLGGLVGASSFALVGRSVPRRALFVGTRIAYPLLCALLIPLPPVWPAAAVLFGIGVMAGAIVPLQQLVRQERTPAELQARVAATVMTSLALVVPPAVLGAGLLVDAAGLQVAFGVYAAGNALVVVIALSSRLPRRL
jgi:MFS family permease